MIRTMRPVFVREPARHVLEQGLPEHLRCSLQLGLEGTRKENIPPEIIALQQLTESKTNFHFSSKSAHGRRAETPLVWENLSRMFVKLTFLLQSALLRPSTCSRVGAQGSAIIK